MTEADLTETEVLTPERQAWFEQKWRWTLLMLGHGRILDTLKLPQPPVNESDNAPRRLVRLSDDQINRIKEFMRPLVEQRMTHQQIVDEVEDAGLDVCERTGKPASHGKLNELIMQIKRETKNFYTIKDTMGPQIFELRERGMMNKDVAKLLGLKVSTASTAYRRYKFDLQAQKK